MLSIFNRKNYPSFWKVYVSAFKQKQPNTIESTRFVVFDTETTGLNTKTDRILSIGAVALFDNTIDVSDSFEVYLKQKDYHSNAIEIHGILKDGELKKLQKKMLWNSLLII